MSAWTRLWTSTAPRWRVDSPRAEPEATQRDTTAPGGWPAETAPRRILFINQYYWPDHASTAQHLNDLAESLVERGYEVHVLCSRGTYRPGQPHRPSYEVHNGVHVHRVGATSLGRKNTVTRMADYLSFYARAALKAARLPRFDLVVTLTTPPLIGLVGTLLRRFRGTRHIYWSMDLHPDASLALGRMSSKNPVVRGLSWLSDVVYRAADRVVVLGPYMADRIAAKHVRPSRVVPIPVWSRRDEIFPHPREGHPLRAQLGLDGKFVAMYSGNLGLAHCFEEFLEAAQQLQHRDDIVFLYVGGGPRLKEVQAVVEAEGLKNVRLMDYFPREQLHASLSTADVHLISMRTEMTGIVVPGKLYGAMASGRPSLFVGPDHCESADTIREAGCGLTVRQGDVAGLIQALERLADEPDLATGMGARGRAAFLAGHERDNCCDRWGWAIGELLGTPPVTVPETIPVPATAPSPALRRVG